MPGDTISPSEHTVPNRNDNGVTVIFLPSTHTFLSAYHDDTVGSRLFEVQGLRFVSVWLRFGHGLIGVDVE